MGNVQPGGQRIAALMAARPQGRLEENSGVEGSRRLYAYHRLGEYPVAAYAGQDVDEVLAPWRTRTSERIRTGLGLSVLVRAFAVVAAIKVGRLSRSEERLERAARATSAGVWELDLRSGRMWRSAQWSHLLGYEVAEIPSTLDGFLSVVHAEDVSLVRLAMAGLKSSDDPMRVEYRVRRKDGNFVWVECTAHVFGRDGALTYAVGSMCDITERKGVELSLRDNARMLNLAQRAADAGVWSIDFRSGVTRWSEGCYRVYGVNPVSAPPGAAAWQELIYQPDRERTARVVQNSIEQHAEFSVEFRIVHPDKGIRWLWTLGNAVRDEYGAPAQMAGITLDITARKMSEEERQALLASERAARAEAERASRAKEEFLAIVSHELRSPLNSIFGWVHVLRTRDKEPELFARSVESIERCAHVQAQLIADLLDISRIEAGTLRLDAEVVSLQPILEAAVSAILPAAEAKGVWLMCEPGMANVRADSARLEQVMWNLLSNAIKFTPKGGVVNVTTRVLDGEVEIRVRDNGVGIPHDFAPHLFKRFSQSERTMRQSLGGLGLGLTIVKHLVEAHGGRVRIDSEGEGRGTTATVRLPLAEAHRRDDPPPDVRPAMPVALNGVRVLLVEDDVDSREVAMLILSGHGAEVTMTDSVDGAWQQLQRFVPQVIVADVSMPDKDGFELMRVVRGSSDAQLRAVPALALSALASAEDRARALASGFNMHVAKPVEPQVLLESVAALAAGRKTDFDSSRSPLRGAVGPVSWSESER
jgi:PAS domain S-box-containing protein